MSNIMIAIIDYDIGNIAAVSNMLQRLGIACKVTSDPSDVEAADRIILPGNGSFDACMRNLRASGLIPILENKVIMQKIPLLGICVGAQMLGSHSEEGVEPGLGWIDMTVHRFPVLPGLKVPHMGWNVVRKNLQSNRLTQKIDQNSRFYFVHSYYMKPVRRVDILLESTYGIDFAAAVSSANICGVQFHPEKSHRFGKQLFAAFAAEA